MNRYPGLADRVVLVTGAAHGLGAELATAFAEQGARLALVDVDAEGLADLGSQLGLTEDRAIMEVVDLADTDVCEPLVARIAERLGGLDVLVNNAAVLKRAALEDVTVEHFERTLRVNLMAPWFLARGAIAVMRRQGRGGRIVNVASMAGRTGGVANVHTYAASKGALLTATRSLARAVAADGILVNAVLPSNIESPMLRGVFPPEAIARTLGQVPLGRTAEPREVAELVLWLASDTSSYVTGVAWDINGGWFMS
jgi:NAD(P)-dependent dehydrogenase (short-subunit alcohol dehydrogenase family)